ncbi:hypothetical protein ACFFUT_05605 [Pseudohalocynthiibacter aestuariivivens]|uniref:ASCH domain-containing protein n=1 Tax=Pseudohalocynthiibacter aestuariivivens TaxID=1591409 RepID=A0ABV5JCR7_9RHOB|nr:hypothetical protein [Pseudohalocynthiibacter aestuariivivens]MBS9717251.1 hypothetical protein [Pseudohalocynthiibacter aestuariivivens]
MTNVKARLNKLENAGKAKRGDLTYITSATNGNDGLETCEDGVHAVNLAGSVRLEREGFASDKAFWAAVEREHQQAYGIPMDQGEECRFVTTYEDKPCALTVD